MKMMTIPSSISFLLHLLLLLLLVLLVLLLVLVLVLLLLLLLTTNFVSNLFFMESMNLVDQSNEENT